MQWWFRAFRKGDGSLEDEERSCWPSEVTAVSWEHHRCWCCYIHMRSCPRTQHRPFHSCLVFEANWKVTKLNKWMLHELTAKKKKIIFLKCCLLLIYMQQCNFSRLNCGVQQKGEFIRQRAVTSSVTGLRRNSKALPRTKLATKNMSWSLYAVCWSDPRQLSESWQNHYIWDVFSTSWWDAPKTAFPCSQHWPTEWAWFFSAITHNYMPHNQRFKSWMNWAMKFCLICHIHGSWPLANWIPLLQASWLFWQGKFFHKQQDGENVFRVHWIPKHRILLLQE